MAEEQPGFPMREWSVEIWMLDDNDKQLPATIFEKVTYELHPTFPKPKQSTLHSQRREIAWRNNLTGASSGEQALTVIV